MGQMGGRQSLGRPKDRKFYSLLLKAFPVPGRSTARRLAALQQPLVSCPGNTRTKSGDLLQDRIGGSGPDEKPPRTIVVLDGGVDFQIGRASCRGRGEISVVAGSF